jgi:hypothetical protein
MPLTVLEVNLPALHFDEPHRRVQARGAHLDACPWVAMNPRGQWVYHLSGQDMDEIKLLPRFLHPGLRGSVLPIHICPCRPISSFPASIRETGMTGSIVAEDGSTVAEAGGSVTEVDEEQNKGLEIVP